MALNSPSLNVQNLQPLGLTNNQSVKEFERIMPLARLHKMWESAGDSKSFVDYLESKGYGINQACALKLGPTFKDASKLISQQEFLRDIFKRADNRRADVVSDAIHAVNSTKETAVNFLSRNNVATRFVGMLQTVGGGFEVVAGGGTAVAGIGLAMVGVPTTVLGVGIPATLAGTALVVGGGALASDGVANAKSGWNALVSGKPSEQTPLERTIHQGVIAVGGSERAADVANLVVGIATPSGAIKQTGVLASKIARYAEMTKAVEIEKAKNASLMATKQSWDKEAAELLKVARTDKLTKIGNRLAFDHDINKLITQANNGGPGFHLVLLDVDDFKVFNTTGGHAMGDQALRAIASKLTSERRIGEQAIKDARIEVHAYRVGGDEFAMLVVDADKAVSNPAAALNVAERARKRIENLRISERVEVRGVEVVKLRPTISAGVASFRKGVNGDDFLKLYKRADKAADISKAKGKNAVSSEAEISNH